VTLLRRGPSTGETGVPRRWTGPLPAPSKPRQLKDDGLFAKIHAGLLAASPDLGVVVWGLLRLSFFARAGVASYRDFAGALGLGHLSDTALDKRFGAALRPLLGTWIIRKRRPDNVCTYVAVVPEEFAGGRYAILRRRDLRLLNERPATGTVPCRPADLADFCRWQLECGQRGWTAEPLRLIANRWNVGHTTLASSRDRLAQLGLLKVVQRSGRRYSDVVWLEELYEPHWQVDSAVDAEVGALPASQTADDPQSAGTGQFCVPISAGAVSGLSPVSCPEDGSHCVPISAGPIKELLPECVTENEPDLGGASAAPLTSATREAADAPPAASRTKNRSNQPGPDLLQASARLVNRYRVFAHAKPHFRRAVITELAAALEDGLAAGHADRALARVADEGSFDAECLLLRRAMQQARADQLTGMCADCGGDSNGHHSNCDQFASTWDDTPLTAPLLGRRTATTAGEDPLAVLVERPVPDGAQPLDEAEAVEWLIVHLARQLLGVSDREARLRAIVLGLRAKAPPGQHELINQAAEHVRYALNRSMAS
jgi:hypothetical protein